MFAPEAPKIFSQLNAALMMYETLCRRCLLLKIPKNYAGLKPERNVSAEHSREMEAVIMGLEGY
jgi:hypothetical protein